MGINIRRLLLLVGIVGLSAIGIGGFVAWRLSDQQQSSRVLAQARAYLDAKDYASAKVEADKLLILTPKNAEGYYLKALALLAGRTTHGIVTSDKARMDAIRQLLKAAKLDLDHTAAHQLLVTYFLSVGDPNEAAIHAKAVLRAQPSDTDAQFARALWRLEQSQPTTATSHIEFLWEKELPLRPRTVWLAAQLGDFAGRRSDWNVKVENALKAYESAPMEWNDGQDLLGLVELATWKARRVADVEQRKLAVNAALTPLSKLVESPAFVEVPPRRILRAIDRISMIGGIPAPMMAQLETTVERVFRRATDGDTLDPAIHIHFANRLHAAGKSEEAVAVISQGIERSQKFGPQVRLAFAACDLWLAEYHLLGGRGEEAKPYIEMLSKLEPYRPWARLLAGYLAMTEGNLESAASALGDAVAGMPKNGAARALYGLCQLRRGLISEGRELLEDGIRLGATEPRYQAWLALALAEAGYYDQAVVVARQLLADPARQGLGRALLGQLKLRAGQLSDAERDFIEAIAVAEPNSRPALRLSLAEIAVERGDWTTAQSIVSELKDTPLAPQAIAIEHRHLTKEGKNAEAETLLTEGRAKHPGNVVLLAMQVRGLVEQKRFPEAIELLRREESVQRQILTPTLLLMEVQELAGDAKGARETLRKACADHPAEGSLRIRLAESLLAQREVDEASRVTEELATNPHVQKSVIDSLRARIAGEKGDFAKAEDILAQASAADPDNPMLKFLLGQLAARNGDYSSASELFQKSLANGAMWNHASKALFESLLYSGATDRAIELVGQVGKRGKATMGMRRRLVEILARQDRAKDLERELDALIKSEPSERDYAVIVSILRSTGHLDRALELTQSGRKAFPESALLAEHQVALFVETDHLEEAKSTLQPLLDADPKNPMTHAWLIEILLRTKGEPATIARALHEAEMEAKAGWEACPGNIVLASLLCQTLLRQQREEEAKSFLIEAKRAHPELPRPEYLLARMFEAIGEPRRAADILEPLVANDKDAVAARHFLRLKSALGENEDFQKTAESLLASHPQDVHVLGMLAERAASAGKFAEAEGYLLKMPPVNQGGAVASYVRGVIAFEKGDLTKAEELLQRGLADPRQNVPATLLLARIRSAQSRSEEAFQVADQVHRRLPELSAPVLIAAGELAKLQRLEEAETYCRDFLKSWPEHPGVQLALANVLVRRSAGTAHAEAAGLAEKTLQDKDLPAEQYEAWLLILCKTKNLERARALLARETASEGKIERILGGGRAFFEAGQFAEACYYADAVLQRTTSSVPALMLRADATARLAETAKPLESGVDAEYARAAELYREVLRLQPGNVPAANNLAWTVGVRLREPRQGLNELTTAIPAAKNPRSDLPADMIDTVGTLHLLLEHWGEARSFLEAAVEKNPRSVSSYFHLGMVHKRQKREALAKQCFDRVLELEPNGPWARQIQESRLAN